MRTKVSSNNLEITIGAKGCGKESATWESILCSACFPDLVQSASDIFNCDIAFSRTHLEPFEIRISHIVSHDKARGNGTRCLKWLIQNLKDAGMKRIALLASPIGGMSKAERAMKCEWLIGWYRRIGFEVVEYNHEGIYLVSAEMEMGL